MIPNNLPPASQPWAREVERRLNQVGSSLSVQGTNVRQAQSGVAGSVRQIAVQNEKIASVETSTNERLDEQGIVIGDVQAELDTRLNAQDAVIDDLNNVVIPELLDDVTLAASDAAEARLLYTTTYATPTIVDGDGRPEGAVWVRLNAQDEVIEQWRWTGSAWVETEFSETIIPNLSAGKITTGTLDTERLDAQQVAAEVGTFLQVRVDQLIASGATIDSAVVSQLWAEVVNSQKITTEMLAVGAGQNYMPDPFFNDPERRAIRAGWTTGASSTRSFVAGTNEYYLRFSGSTTSESGVRLTYTGDDMPGTPVMEGERYNIEVQYRGTGTEAQITASFYTASGTFLISTVEDTTDISTGWQSLQNKVTVPENAAEMRITVYARPSGGYVEVRRPRIRNMADASLVVDGSIEARNINIDDLFADDAFIANLVTQGVIVLSDDDPPVPVISLTQGSGFLAIDPATGDPVAQIDLNGNVTFQGVFRTEPVNHSRAEIWSTPSGQGQFKIIPNDDDEGTNAILWSGGTGYDWMALDYFKNSVLMGRYAINDSETKMIRNYTHGGESGAVWINNAGRVNIRVRHPTEGHSVNDFWMDGLGEFFLGDIDNDFGRIFHSRSPNTLIAGRTPGHYTMWTNDGYTEMIGNGLRVFGSLNVTGTKNFVMDHPTEPEASLVHASTESPHNGVEYWSDEPVTVGSDGTVWVELPEYFGPLTYETGRVAMLTANSPNADLWHEGVTDTGFLVHGTPGARFSWLVKARRMYMDQEGNDKIAFDPVQYNRDGVDPVTPPTIIRHDTEVE